MYKLNILPVKLLDSTMSKTGAIFSHEACDVCGMQGIKFEAVSYKDKFDYSSLRYHSYTYKKYQALTEDCQKRYATETGMYLIYYLCSEACAMMVQLQRE